MPTWNDLRLEIQKRNNNNDIVRREKLRQLHEITGRDLIIYAADFFNPAKVPGNEVGINLQDKEGFIEVIANLTGPALDVLIHSPGGSAEATESIVELLRRKFTDIRFIVPNVAKSAATMMTLSGNVILLDRYAELGPIDPQMIINKQSQTVVAPAHAIIEQFDKARAALEGNPNYLPAWMPILEQYGPALLTQCEHAIELSRSLVSTWLQRYMFDDHKDAEEKANKIANWLGEHANFRSHGRHIGIKQLQEQGINVVDLQDDPTLYDAVWQVYTSISLTFNNTGAFKIIENHLGDAYIRVLRIAKIELGAPPETQDRVPQPSKQAPSLNKGKQRKRGKKQKK